MFKVDGLRRKLRAVILARENSAQHMAACTGQNARRIPYNLPRYNSPTELMVISPICRNLQHSYNLVTIYRAVNIPFCPRAA